MLSLLKISNMALWIMGIGNKVKVHRISTEDDLFGIIVKVRFGRKKYHFPLNELKALDKESSNYKLLEDYTRWSPEDEL